MELKNRYIELIKTLSEKEMEVENEFKKLKELYSLEYKKYHNLTHLTELFKSFEKYKTELENREEVAFAIFYHDIIYNLGDSKNEEKSGNEAKRVLEMMEVDSLKINRIVDLIECTKSHEANSMDEAWMIDFDLGILGQSWEVYQSYSSNIRQEYKKIPSILYRNGRKKVLKHFLAKETIYKTETFQSLFEENARINLKRELDNI